MKMAVRGNMIKALFAAIVVVLLATVPARAVDMSNSAWSQTDNNNNQTPPTGWPAGMLPTQVEPTARAMMGANKRWWTRQNPVQSTTGTAPHYVYTPTNATYPPSYFQGETFCFKANFTSAGSDDLNINSLGAKPIYKFSTAGAQAIGAGEIQAGEQVCMAYDGVLNSSSGGFQLLTQSIFSQGSGVASVADNVALKASATSLYPLGVYRRTFGNGNGAAPQWYLPSAAACSLNAGAGDNGTQVQSADGKCWLADIQPSTGMDIREWGAACDWSGTSGTDTTSIFNAATASAVKLIVVPTGCYVAGVVTLGTGQVLKNFNSWAGLLEFGNDYLSIANVILGASGYILSGGAQGSRSGIDGLVIVASNYVAPTTLRSAITAAAAFTGTAVKCANPDFSVKNTLIIGFQYPLYGTATDSSGDAGVQCDRLSVDWLAGDNTNGIYFDATPPNSATSDIPHINHVHLWPAIVYNANFAPYQTMAISNVTDDGGGLIEITLSGAPSTALVTGDTVQIAPMAGTVPAYGRWVITVLDTTHFTLNGSTFSGSYSHSASDLAYLSSFTRTGHALHVEHVATPFIINDYFAQTYDTGYYWGTGAQLSTCTGCTYEWSPQASADPTSIAIDVESNAEGITFNGGYMVAATGVKSNTTAVNLRPTTISNLNVFAAWVHTTLAEQGSITFPGTTIPFGVIVANAASNDMDITSGTVQLAAANLIGAPVFSGTVGSFGSTEFGEKTWASPSTTPPQWLFGDIAHGGSTHELELRNVATSANTVARITAETGTSNAYTFMENADGVTPTGLMQSGSGNTGGLIVQTLAGPLTLTPFTDVNLASGGLQFGGTTAITSDAIPILPAKTFATLPTPSAGMLARITDGLAGSCGDGTCTTFGTPVTAGGGALKLFVWYNGTNWTLTGK